MDDPQTLLYWKKLRSAWKEDFIENVIQKFNDKAYLFELGEQLGFDKSRFEKLLENFEGIEKENLGSALYDSIWRDTFEKVIEVSKDLSFSVEEIPLIGTLPIGRVNAMALIVPDNKKYILAFAVGLLPLIIGISNYLASNFEIVEGEENNFVFKEEVYLGKAEGLVHLIINFCLGNEPVSQDKPVLEKEKQHGISKQFRKIMKLFVVGHEFAHVGLQHFQEEEVSNFKLNDGFSYAVSEVKDFEKEYEADQVGFLIAAVSYLKQGIPYWFSAAYIVAFFEFTACIDSGIEAIFGVKRHSFSHPPIQERIRGVEQVLFQLIEERQQVNYFAIKRENEKMLVAFKNLFFQRITQMKENKK